MTLHLRRFIWRTLKKPGPPPGLTLEDAGNLFDRGAEFNRRGMHREALEIARELASYRYTGAWEIEAVALHELGEADRAIELLQKGIEKMPVWRNGHLLGIYLSEEGRYEEALQAFDASLEMFEPQPAMTAYNRAIVLNRSGHTDEAVTLLEETISSDAAQEEPEALELASDFLARLKTTTPDMLPPRRRTKRPSRAWRGGR
ncbi:MAG TPA: tetratricopeptide repeat protein [Allosphingosinicella sp.]